MKLNKPSAKTTLTKLATGNIHVDHRQSVKVNYNYHSAEASFGVGFEVVPEDAQEACEEARKFVEKQLGEKVPDLQNTVRNLG